MAGRQHPPVQQGHRRRRPRSRCSSTRGQVRRHLAARAGTTSTPTSCRSSASSSTTSPVATPTAPSCTSSAPVSTPGNTFGGRIDNVQDPQTGHDRHAAGVRRLLPAGRRPGRAHPQPDRHGRTSRTTTPSRSGSANQLLKVMRTEVTRQIVRNGWPILGLAAFTPEIEQAGDRGRQRPARRLRAGHRPDGQLRHQPRRGGRGQPQGPRQGHRLHPAGRRVPAVRRRARRCSAPARAWPRAGGAGSAFLGVGMGVGQQMGQAPQRGGPMPPPAPGFPGGGAGYAAAGGGGAAAITCPNCRRPTCRAPSSAPRAARRWPRPPWRARTAQPQNQPGAKFCSSCGTAMTPAPATCAKCGEELAPGAKFCAIVRHPDHRRAGNAGGAGRRGLACINFRPTCPRRRRAQLQRRRTRRRRWSAHVTSTAPGRASGPPLAVLEHRRWRDRPSCCVVFFGILSFAAWIGFAPPGRVRRRHGRRRRTGAAPGAEGQPGEAAAMPAADGHSVAPSADQVRAGLDAIKAHDPGFEETGSSPTPSGRSSPCSRRGPS